MELIPGQIVTFKNSRRTYTVKVLAGRQFTRDNDSGQEYIMFPGIRVRPNEHSVSFGRETFYTARSGELVISEG